MLVARLRKKLEHTLKSVIADGVRYLANSNVFIIVLLQDTVSVHKPGFYMKRFYDHISTKVFRKEVKC